MPGLVPGIHVFATKEVVDGPDKPGPDEIKSRFRSGSRDKVFDPHDEEAPPGSQSAGR